MRWSWCWVSNYAWLVRALHHLRLHSRTHSRGHYTLSSSSSWPSVMVLESLLELDSLNILLVLNFFLDVLVSLQQFVMLSLTKLESLIQVCLQFFLQSIHLILLFLDELGLSCNDLFRSFFHVFFPLFSLKFLTPDLDLMGLLILLLFCKIILNLLHVQKFRAELECQWQLVSKNLSVTLDFNCMAVLKLTKSLCILLLSL